MKQRSIVVVGSFLIMLLGTAACHNDSKIAVHDVTVDYTAPPTNTVEDAIGTTTAALNARDSAAFWNSLVWEDQSNSSYRSAAQAAQRCWDSLKGSHCDIRILHSYQFRKHVHIVDDTALFANTLIDVNVTGAKTGHCDSLMAILRVDNGKWVVGSFSLDTLSEMFFPVDSLHPGHG
jgi:hypothetical protein